MVGKKKKNKACIRRKLFTSKTYHAYIASYNKQTDLDCEKFKPLANFKPFDAATFLGREKKTKPKTKQNKQKKVKFSPC